MRWRLGVGEQRDGRLRHADRRPHGARRASDRSRPRCERPCRRRECSVGREHPGQHRVTHRPAPGRAECRDPGRPARPSDRRRDRSGRRVGGRREGRHGRAHRPGAPSHRPEGPPRQPAPEPRCRRRSALGGHASDRRSPSRRDAARADIGCRNRVQARGPRPCDRLPRGRLADPVPDPRRAGRVPAGRRARGFDARPGPRCLAPCPDQPRTDVLLQAQARPALLKRRPRAGLGLPSPARTGPAQAQDPANPVRRHPRRPTLRAPSGALRPLARNPLRRPFRGRHLPADRARPRVPAEAHDAGRRRGRPRRRRGRRPAGNRALQGRAGERQRGAARPQRQLPSDRVADPRAMPTRSRSPERRRAGRASTRSGAVRRI